MFGFDVKQKKLRGVKLIDSVADRFEDMIAELDEGACQCQDERNSICATIDRLREKDCLLGDATKRAKTISDNLRTILGP